MATKQQIQRFFEEMSGFHHLLAGSKDSPMKKFKIGPTQAKILYMISSGDCTVNQIANTMGVSSSAATQIIESLVKTGLAHRQTDSKDRRVVHIALTEKGKKKFEEFRKAHLRYMEFLFGDLTEQEMETLISLPKKMINRLKKR